jgi:hypothetical protein
LWTHSLYVRVTSLEPAEVANILEDVEVNWAVLSNLTETILEEIKKTRVFLQKANTG